MTEKELFIKQLKKEPIEEKPITKYFFLVTNNCINLMLRETGACSTLINDEQIETNGVTTNEFKETISSLPIGSTNISMFTFCPWLGNKKNSNSIAKFLKDEGIAYETDAWKITYNQKEIENPDKFDRFKIAVEDFINQKEPTYNHSDTIKTPSVISIKEIEEKEVSWLISDYIPRGQISIIAGDGGSGKTTTWCSIAAAISSGKKAFFDPIPEQFEQYEPQKVLFFSSEDSLEYTLKARLRKAGANMSNIYSVPLTDDCFNEIKFDSSVLETLIAQVKPALCIFDPLQSFIPPNIQMGKRNEMRNCLNRLIGLGEKYNCTFLIICHTNKQTGVYGRKRISDSADIWDISRSVFIVGETADHKRYLSNEKNNYAETGETAIFTIEDGLAVFNNYSDKKDQDFVRERDYNAYQAPQRQDAEKFILDFLKNGKKPTKDLDEAASAAGISKKTMERAKTQLRKKKILNISSDGFGSNKIFYSYLSNNHPIP